jgi:hypothetical protein
MKKTMPWFRFYVETLNDPKIERLSDRQYRGWTKILAIARLHDGALPPVDDIAFLLRYSAEEAKGLLDQLIERGLVDRTKQGGLQPHGWDSRQYKSDTSTERVRKHRTTGQIGRLGKTARPRRPSNGDGTFHGTFHGASRNVSETADGTPPETETDTDTEAEAENPDR